MPLNLPALHSLLAFIYHSTMPAKALRTHYKIKHLYNDMEPFKLERDKIKTLITPTKDPAWTKKRKEIIENLQAIHMIAYRDTTIRDPIRVMQIERLAIRAINGMLEEDNQRGFFIQGLYHGPRSAGHQRVRAHLAKTPVERLWWMSVIVRTAVCWNLSKEILNLGITKDCSDARAVLEEAYDVVAMMRVMPTEAPQSSYLCRFYCLLMQLISWIF
ncbi:hypothetical protein HBH98_129140 [Parastagonospora nodorum]|nr:hypothetical protein HBH51_026550 [Parastagonospora nodorum]KAH4155290.1 hypothetical protein HBH43_214530 [Parastagonospora nodorum]KAH4344861.1 hypothetical protein HBH98_129140 [Parastagonospora nodorum]KAH4365239.1 hypothetical protein HBH97_175110 [Parastagonospora nodorum]KAH4383689.1 hypothetical protein HBH99_184030 [Parastagonospora nodorum]